MLLIATGPEIGDVVHFFKKNCKATNKIKKFIGLASTGPPNV